MSLRRSAFFSLTLALSASGCRHRYDRDVPITGQTAVDPASEGTANNQVVVTPSASDASNVAPSSAPMPAPQEVAPQAVAPQAVAPQAVAPQAVAPQAVAPQAVAPQAVVPVSPPFAPQVQPTINDAGVIVPVVPLYIDPGATPGTPGNGAPDNTTNGQP